MSDQNPKTNLQYYNTTEEKYILLWHSPILLAIKMRGVVQAYRSNNSYHPIKNQKEQLCPSFII